MKKKGLAPIIDENTRILILGSLPSDESISNQQYYSNPGNDFWKLINEVIGEDITKLDYEAKVQKLQAPWFLSKHQPMLQWIIP